MAGRAVRGTSRPPPPPEVVVPPAERLKSGLVYSDTLPEQQRLQTVLQRLGAAFEAGWELDATLQTVVDLAVEIFGCSGGVLRLLHPDHGLVAKAATGAASTRHLLPLTFRPDEGIVGQVVTTQQPARINAFDPSGHPHAESIEAAGISALLCVPILASNGGNSLGCLTVHNKLSQEPFSADDEALLSAFAAHAAIALERALLLEAERAAAQEAAILHQVAEASSSLDLREVLDVACAKSLEVSGARLCAVLLLAEDRPEVVAAQCHGLPLPLRNVFPGFRTAIDFDTDPAWIALLAGAPIRIPEAAPTSPFAQRLLEFFREERAALVPLLAHRRLIGVLFLDDTGRSNMEAPRSLRILASVARQLATSIEKARLYDQLDRQVRVLSALNRLSEVLTSTQDLSALLQGALAESMQLLAVTTGSIMLYHPVRRTLKVEAAVGLAARVARRREAPLGEGVAGWVALHRQPVRINNAAGDCRFRLLADRPEIAAALCVPLTVGTDLVGVLNLSRASPGASFSAEDQDLAVLMAGHVAVAVQNAIRTISERRVAQMARRSLMPRLRLTLPGLDIGEKHVPAEDVGGDYYDLYPTCDGRVAILVSDVSGKSVSAAMHAAMGKYFIRALGHQSADPAEVLTASNALIAAETPDEVFISLFYGLLDLRTGELAYANAGHVPPMLARQSGCVEELQSTGMLLGLFEDSQIGRATTVLRPGDALVCYTDGITEARRDRELFGYDRLKSVIARTRHDAAQTIADKIYRRTLRYCRRSLDDDIALLILKFLG